ncbi:uncharacterized protein LOC119391604 [Rhipicephalus sanguineus]|uniref:uncharacterized protein LOC119391604 n=1 Tax=Rhipicephalus sanguineus TaxID=34632 RepID=UPI0020C50F3F|nr:uncharacterized protein LOC119391604 [Rhipicephalus sanguineus]
MSNILYPSTGWASSLARLPRLQDRDHSQLACAPGTGKKARRSYKLLTESYVITSTLRACYEQEKNARYFIKARCYRSKKKTQTPYLVCATISGDGSVLDGKCECPAGNHFCSHVQAVLDTLRLLQEKGFGEVPAHLSCTDLPQYWRRPRGDTIKGSSLQNVDWRRVGEGGRDLPLPCRIDLSAIKERNVEDWRKDLAQFAQALSDANADSALVTVLAAADRAPVCSSRCGTVFCGSPLAYQQPLVPHGFTVLLCSYLGEKLNKHDKSATPCLPKPMVPFTGSSQWAIPGGISGGERRILEKIVLSPLQAQCLEKNSQQQRASQTWCQERKHRLTSSNFGTVLMRSHWSSKGLGHLTSAKDLSRVPAVRYGIANEARALQRYQDVLRHTGRDVELQSVGLFVNPEQPWLGASPDAIVHDPVEDPPWGCVEVKCPYSMKDADQEKLLSCQDICVSFDSLNHPALKQSHPYFAQVMGQMAITKLQWADFVMYGENYICVQRVRFDEKVWHEMKAKLDSFYFDTLLPYFVRNVG